MNKFFSIICLLFSYLTYAQNLVPNSSFEEVKNPPCAFISFGSSINKYFADWVAPTGGTSDAWYFDSTQANTCEQNLFRYQQKPKEGNYCAGIITSTKGSLSSQKLYREYIQIPLTNALEINKIYYAEFYVLLHKRSELATSNIGMYLSESTIRREENKDNFGSVLNYVPQIKANQLITDKNSWTKISGCFMANEACKYLTIGNFLDDDNTNLALVTNEAIRLGSYYLIDNVTVRDAETSALPSPNFLGPDTTLCHGQILTVNLPKSEKIVYSGWELSRPHEYNFTESGIYSITASSGLCSVEDNLQLAIETPARLPADTTICIGETLTISPNETSKNYTWSDGTTASSLKVTKPGVYWINGIASVCNTQDSIRVNFVPCPGEIPNVFTPNGDGINETFYIDGIAYTPWHLRVCNRWGSQVYESKVYNNEWDGRDLPAGLYYYYLSNSLLGRTLKGWVQILR